MDDKLKPDPEMLKMLDVLMNMQVLEQEPEWDLLENMQDNEEEELDLEEKSE